MNIEEKKEEVNSLKSMIESCFAYGGLDEPYTFNKYILPYKKRLGSKLFDKVFEDHKNYLENNYTIDYDTYEDHEGLTYNSLTKIEGNENI